MMTTRTRVTTGARRARPERTAMSAEPLLATTVPAPAGDLTFVLTPEDGVVRVAGFSPLADVAARIPAALAERGLEVVAPDDVADHPTLEPVVRAVERYAAGDVAALDDVPVEQPGGPFFQRAWAAMRAIPAGSTATYAELAVAAGSPMAVRAAGSACSRNLVAPFVPCHRVLRSGGKGLLGGYYFGLDAKRALLGHEGAAAVSGPAEAVPAAAASTAAAASRADAATTADAVPAADAAAARDGVRPDPDGTGTGTTAPARPVVAGVPA
jgi:methylated-DNA-[protein]-cysteine S-methyltransferase